MSPNFTRPALLALAGLPLALLAGTAEAQVARYCDGRLAALSFTSSVQGTSSSPSAPMATVYSMRLQNTTRSAVNYVVRFSSPGVNPTSLQNGGNLAVLQPSQTADIQLARHVHMVSAGAGPNPRPPAGMSPTDPNNGVPRYTTVTCPASGLTGSASGLTGSASGLLRP